MHSELAKQQRNIVLITKFCLLRPLLTVHYVWLIIRYYAVAFLPVYEPKYALKCIPSECISYYESYLNTTITGMRYTVYTIIITLIIIYYYGIQYTY